MSIIRDSLSSFGIDILQSTVTSSYGNEQIPREDGFYDRLVCGEKTTQNVPSRGWFEIRFLASFSPPNVIIRTLDRMGDHRPGRSYVQIISKTKLLSIDLKRLVPVISAAVLGMLIL